MSEEQGLSKKELRAQKRAEKQARKAEEESRAKKESFTQNIFTWTLVAVLGIGLVFFVSTMVSNESLDVEQEIVISEDEPVMGNPDAVVTLVEYGDFMCPACGAAYHVVESIMADHPEDVRFVYRNFPFLSPKSHLAARALESAGEQGKFFEMYSILFLNQDEWSNARNTNELIAGYAEEIELDIDIFNEDMSSREVNDRISGQLEVARALGVTATPTFFINGQRVNASTSHLSELVSDAIEEANRVEVEAETEGGDAEEFEASE